MIVYRYLPRQLAGDASFHGPVEATPDEALESMAELAVAVTSSAFPDGVDDEAATTDQDSDEVPRRSPEPSRIA